MDAKKLEAMRAAAAGRGARGTDRSAAARVDAVLKAGSSRRSERSNRSTRSVEAVLRKGGRSGAHRKLDTESE
jgi:hypothetical protein